MKLSIVSFINHFRFVERVSEGTIDFYVTREKDYVQINGRIEQSNFCVLMTVVEPKSYGACYSVEFEETVTSTGRPLYDLAKCLERNAYILGELRDGMQECRRGNKLEI